MNKSIASFEMSRDANIEVNGKPAQTRLSILPSISVIEVKLMVILQ